MIELKAVYVTQVQKAQTKTPVALTVGDAEQPVSNNRVFFIQLKLIAIATFADSKQLAGKTYADASVSDRVLCHLLSEMASPLFCHSLLNNFGFEPFFGIHLFQAAVFIFQLF